MFMLVEKKSDVKYGACGNLMKDSRVHQVHLVHHVHVVHKGVRCA
jgi:intracellular sulfur oxidation DsrE/DsrF family protein